MAGIYGAISAYGANSGRCTTDHENNVPRGSTCNQLSFAPSQNRQRSPGYQLNWSQELQRGNSSRCCAAANQNGCKAGKSRSGIGKSAALIFNSLKPCPILTS